MAYTPSNWSTTVVLLCLFLIGFYSLRKTSVEPFHLYRACKSIKHTDVDVLTMQSLGLSPTYDESDPWKVYLPCSYTYGQHELKKQHDKFVHLSKDHVVVLIDGMDYLAAKDALWTLLKNYYGRLRAQIFMPETWSLNNADDIKQFELANKHGNFIYKKNEQRQEGLKVVSFPSIQEAKQGKYVLIQRMQERPYLVAGHKVNLRLYVAICCRKGEGVRAYLYGDGFCYYTPQKYQANSIDPAKTITSGYADRSVYQYNPLTLQDFMGYLARVHSADVARTFHQNSVYLIKGIIKAVEGYLCKDHAATEAAFCQLFGVDLTVDETLQNSKVLEWNKGPSMSFMDDRDKQVKLKLNRDMYALAMRGEIALQDPQNGFIRIH